MWSGYQRSDKILSKENKGGAMTLEEFQKLVDDPEVKPAQLLGPFTELLKRKDGSFEKAVEYCRGRRDGVYEGMQILLKQTR